MFISLAARSEGHPIRVSPSDARYVWVPNGRLGLARFSVKRRSANHTGITPTGERTKYSSRMSNFLRSFSRPIASACVICSIQL
jgi:hypothetical protein